MEAQFKYIADTIYPLTIIQDRYTGVYSGGKYTAWNMTFEEIPAECRADDADCRAFWADNDIPVGKGLTVDAAIHSLAEQLKVK